MLLIKVHAVRATLENVTLYKLQSTVRKYQIHKSREQ